MTLETPRDHCGVFGIYCHDEAALMTYLGLYALQHRGQESAGIVTNDGKRFYFHKNMGLVSEVFNENHLSRLKGNCAIGHVRYSTTGSSLLVNAQPLVINYYYGTMAVAHNGNLTNANELREKLERMGSIFQTTTDSEIVVHLLAKPSFPNKIDRLIYALGEIKGAYSLILMSQEEIIGIRDPHGIRPLVLGKLDEAYVLASETCAFDLIGAHFIRDVEPGEVVIINENGIKSIKPMPDTPHKFCIFELIYFARPDSFFFGKSVHTVRKALGARLAKEHPVSADIVISVPDSGNSAAIGFASESGIPYDRGFIRNHYVGRTFLKPNQMIRNFSTKIKLNPLKDVIEGKRVVVVDDSIVRGTTSKSRIASLRDAGAKEIHMRISCPPHRFPCYYGIDFPSNTELIAAQHNLDEVARFIQADSLGYLSIEGMIEAVGGEKEFCLACFNGDYAIKPECGTTKEILERNNSTVRL
ncbi:MAG: amidophosphoribosyltransferase [Candidatus Auribacterota bacterium]|jgi:amidophosphoribosyltransferase|nr:amidophosphoribosyltransferase [Candidatus Auribacterota bacterium]